MVGVGEAQNWGWGWGAQQKQPETYQNRHKYQSSQEYPRYYDYDEDEYYDDGECRYKKVNFLNHFYFPVFCANKKVNVCSIFQNDILLPLTNVCHCVITTIQL